MTLSTRAPRDVTAALLAQIAPNAARLKAATNSHLGRALLVAVNVHLLAIGIFWAVSYATFTPAPPAETPWRIIDIPSPTGPSPAPKITETSPGGGAPSRSPAAGLVTPVPETQARPDATVPRNADIAVSTAGPVGPTPNAGGPVTGPGDEPVAQTAVTAGTTPPSVPPRRADPVVETPQPVFLERSEVAPALVGGFDSFQAGIAYPRFDREAGVSGQVVVRFIVGTDGVPGTIEVVRSVSPGLDRAAMEAVRSARFTPGIQNGRVVAVRMTLPVTFTIR